MNFSSIFLFSTSFPPFLCLNFSLFFFLKRARGTHPIFFFLFFLFFLFFFFFSSFFFFFFLFFFFFSFFPLYISHFFYASSLFFFFNSLFPSHQLFPLYFCLLLPIFYISFCRRKNFPVLALDASPSEQFLHCQNLSHNSCIITYDGK